MSQMKGHRVRTVAVVDFKAHLAEALREVESGGRIVVERHGKPVAVLVPPGEVPVAAEDWWRELSGIVADVEDFDEIMREVVRSRRKTRARPVNLEE
jgi:prevent-host-death family protein